MKETEAQSPSTAGSAPQVLAATGHEVFWLHLKPLMALPTGHVPGEPSIT